MSRLSLSCFSSIRSSDCSRRRWIISLFSVRSCCSSSRRPHDQDRSRLGTTGFSSGFDSLRDRSRANPSIFPIFSSCRRRTSFSCSRSESRVTVSMERENNELAPSERRRKSGCAEMLEWTKLDPKSSGRERNVGDGDGPGDGPGTPLDTTTTQRLSSSSSN